MLLRNQKRRPRLHASSRQLPSPRPPPLGLDPPTRTHLRNEVSQTPATVRPAPKHLAQGPGIDGAKAFFCPDPREVLEAHAITRLSSVSYRSLPKELRDEVFPREEGGGRLEHGRGLVSDALAVVPDGDLDAPREELTCLVLEDGVEGGRLLRGGDGDAVYLVGFEGEATGHRHHRQPATEGLAGGHLEEGGIGEGEELRLGGVDRPGVLVEPSHGHGVPSSRDLLGVLVVQAHLATHILADGEAAGLEVVGSSRQHVLAQAKVGARPAPAVSSPS